jgi:hypothetical protein
VSATLMLHPHEFLVIFFMEFSRGNIMGSEGGFIGSDHGR